MVAIHTKFLGPTNNRGSRYKAYSTKDRNTVTIEADYALSLEDNHIAAIKAYCKMMGWFGKLAIGGTDTGLVAVFVGSVGSEYIEINSAGKSSQKNVGEARDTREGCQEQYCWCHVDPYQVGFNCTSCGCTVIKDEAK